MAYKHLCDWCRRQIRDHRSISIAVYDHIRPGSFDQGREFCSRRCLSESLAAWAAKE